MSELTSTHDSYFAWVISIGRYQFNLLKLYYTLACQLLDEVTVEGILNLESDVGCYLALTLGPLSLQRLHFSFVREEVNKVNLIFKGGCESQWNLDANGL